MKRVGLFGGSFDPVHNAHVALANVALATLQLDELRWVPAGQPWQKVRPMTPAVHREAMLRLALVGEPRFVLERCELERSGPSYTIDTVRELQAREPGAAWFLVIGQDQYANLPTWRHWQELLTRVTLAVAQRPGAPLPVHPDVLQLAHEAVPLAAMDISSSAIRVMLQRGEDVAHLVPPEVARYIESRGLYQAPPSQNRS
jgi:nicotinate-nucleotide adenylyltransferase